MLYNPTSVNTQDMSTAELSELIDAEVRSWHGNLDDDDRDDMWTDFEYALSEDDSDTLVPPLDTARVIDRHGGEDCGPEYWFVFSVDFGDGHSHMFRLDGTWKSYEGATISGPPAAVKIVGDSVTEFPPITS